MKTMQADRFSGPERLTIAEVAEPEPPAGQVRSELQYEVLALIRQIWRGSPDSSPESNCLIFPGRTCAARPSRGGC